MNQNRVYLAGPIGFVDYVGATQWREHAARVLADSRINAFSPMRGKAFLSHVKGKIGISQYAENPLATEAGVLTRDTFDIRNCDLVLANVLGADVPSCGTAMELGMAHVLGKPIVLVIEEEGNPYDHMMIRRAAGYRVTNLDDALEIVRVVLNPF